MFRRLLSVLLLLLSFATTALAQPSLRYRVEGVDDALRSNIRAYLGPSPRDEREAARFQQSAISRAHLALDALGYYRAAVTTRLDEASSPPLMTLVVSPGDPVRYTDVAVTLDGPGADDPVLSELMATQAPREGQPVHHGQYEGFKTQLQLRARERGYFDARFIDQSVAVHAADGTAELRLRMNTGERYRFGGFSYDATLIDADLLSSLADYEQGDYYTQRDLLSLRQRLTRLGYFAGVTVLPELDDENPGVVGISVDLVPGPAHSYEVGVGYSTDTRQRLSLVWSSPRLNRYGHSQQTSLRWSPVNPQARVTYSIPLDDPSNDVVQLIARLEDNEFGDLQSNQREFKLRRELTNGRRVWSADARVLDEQWGVFDDNFSANFILAGATFSTRIRSGSPVDPSSGLSQFYSVEAGTTALGSDEDLVRLTGRFAGVKRVNDDWRMVWRAEGGLLWSGSRRPDELPPSLAFFAGGDNSIRGFAYQSVGREVSPATLATTSRFNSLVVGGTRLATASLEAQRYLNESWRLAAFVDAGDAFVDDFDANVGVGFGVHYLSPVGALRLELASPVSDNAQDVRIHINIGAEF